ncbi:MAG: hypothetical protein AAFQ36_09430 [Pseudomonadota bacterium]
MSKAVSYWYDAETGLYLGSGTTASGDGVGCTEIAPPPRDDMGEGEERRVFNVHTQTWFRSAK